MTSRPHKFRHHRREIRQLKKRLAAGEQLVELLATGIQLQPLAESYFKAGIGTLAHAVAGLLTQKPPPPDPQPSTVLVTPAFGLYQRKDDA